MKTVLTLCCLLLAGPSFADAYRWVDENGVVHYSDRPREGAEVIELQSDPPRPRVATPAPALTPVTNTAAASTTTAPAAAATTTEYEQLEIVRPLQGETLWNIGSVAAVALRLTPGLAPNHRIYLVYDGIRLTGLPTTTLDIELPEVYRGEHTLQAQVEDIDGNVVEQSSLRRFYVQQSVVRR